MPAARKEFLAEYGNFSNPRKVKQFGVYDENAKMRAKKLLDKKHQVTCLKCGFKGPVWKFSAAWSHFHDMRCAQCGTVKLDTSNIKKILGKDYGFGVDNRLEKRFIPKRIKPDYGD
jgi:hypothetical protein